MKRIRSATVMETLVAMVIILVVFAAAVTVFVQVSGSSGPSEKLAAQSLIEQYLRQPQDGDYGSNASLSSGSLDLKYQVKEHVPPYTYKVILSVYNRQQKLVERQERVLLIHEEEP